MLTVSTPLQEVILKNAQCESCKLRFIWGKMRTIAWETALQIALRNCSKGAGGKVSIYESLGRGEYMQSSTYFSRRFLLVSWSLWVRILVFLDVRKYKNQSHNISSWNYLSEDLSWQFFPSAEWLTSDLYPKLLSGHAEGQQLQ